MDINNIRMTKERRRTKTNHQKFKGFQSRLIKFNKEEKITSVKVDVKGDTGLYFGGRVFTTDPPFSLQG